MRTMRDVEMRTREMGRELFARAAGRQPRVGSGGWWDEQLMGLSMRDEGVKVQLFRFVDVLPALKTAGQISRHLREYLGQVKGGVGVAAGWLPGNGWAGGWVAAAVDAGTKRLARRFIAGEDVEQTLATLERLRGERMGFTVDLLGEAVVSEAEAEEYQRTYLRIIEPLARRAEGWREDERIDRDHQGRIPRVNVSVKLSSLYSQFDPIDPVGTSRAVRERLRPILRAAREWGAFVNIDMEQSAFKEVTIRIFREVLEEEEFRDWADVGIAIQAYLKSCEEDLEGLARWVERRGVPVGVRLVKGAYWDYETVVARQNNWGSPVFEEKAATDASFEAATAFLVERHEMLRPAVASHNVRSIAHAMALAEEHGVPKGSMEFQLLYGMGDGIKSALVEMGQRVRVYAPFGRLLPGMAYLVRRLLENTSNQSFLRAGFVEGVPVEELLMNPLEMVKRVVRRSDGHGNGDALSAPFRNEPLTDFSVGANREAMEGALRDVKDRLGQTMPLVIGGKRVWTEKSIKRVNPSRVGQVVGWSAARSGEHVEQAVGAAKEAFAGWRDTPVEKRAGVMLEAAKVLRRRRFELAAWMVYECGKPWREADWDVAEAIDYCEYYAREMVKLARPRGVSVAGEENETFHEPRGVAVIIAPWNFPLAILCGMTAAALVSGNTAIMKPAEQSSIIAGKLMEVFEEAGVPAGVVNYLPGVGGEVGPALVGHRDVAIIAFTGSKGVGLEINRLAVEVKAGQEHVKRVITEMGGKNAIIVDEDADLDEAVHGVVGSAFGYAGQKCSACSRVIVSDAVYDVFLGRLVEATKSLKVGPAEEAGSVVGPVIDEEAHRRIRDYIETGKGEGKLVYAGEVGGMEGWFVGPHVFADVPETAVIAREEIFGPVLAVMRARDLEEALRIANGTQYALTGGVYSRSPESIARVRREFRVGNLYINRKITGALVERQPFGGFKMSGMGAKAGGAEYLLQFVVQRTVTENTLRRGFAPVGGVGDEEVRG